MGFKFLSQMHVKIWSQVSSFKVETALSILIPVLSMQAANIATFTSWNVSGWSQFIFWIVFLMNFMC